MKQALEVVELLLKKLLIFKTNLSRVEVMTDMLTLEYIKI